MPKAVALTGEVVGEFYQLTRENFTEVEQILRNLDAHAGFDWHPKIDDGCKIFVNKGEYKDFLYIGECLMVFPNKTVAVLSPSTIARHYKVIE